MLLIRVFESDLNSYPYTENIIEDAIYEVIQSDHKWFFDTNPLIVQCIAVDPANIPTITSNFANEIIYLEDRIS
ncbi:hypothetical protein B0A58_04385 [Flavobacterium branchiophilum NBRC 15030 = ATCC 35035]|uniref:Uncharacterized protein n=1 Tax=Flavobacterium branchiophilum TaxID=55197 RepID=A0A543G393_9FLAO|nr:hypothetical protein [Flavobacterium branchiophilum]OXA78468.1 hypothetical protein B0A58_04385 [Flavobacterium branchiophilum NBRC 15030 = ATCC 35035]TQM40549.1 hypothetical protein BC670_1440 [Flavobacterium branchiophilum]GEM55879.1 hypothetical protein FB1_21000 [Flavobacterium branchiophilum NBRC 15030 = ATCC 35035]